MAVQYLLPCSCGQQVVVEPRQAGETTVCACGASLMVPTLLDMRKLEPAQPVSVVPTPAAWGLKHRLRMLGIVLLLVAMGIGGFLLLHPPTSQFLNVDPDVIRKNAQKLSPVQTWDAWQKMKVRIDPRVDQQYVDHLRIFHLELSLLALLSLIAISVIVAGEITARRRQSPGRH